MKRNRDDQNHRATTGYTAVVYLLLKLSMRSKDLKLCRYAYARCGQVLELGSILEVSGSTAVDPMF